MMVVGCGGDGVNVRVEGDAEEKLIELKFGTRLVRAFPCFFSPNDSFFSHTSTKFYGH